MKHSPGMNYGIIRGQCQTERAKDLIQRRVDGSAAWSSKVCD